MPNNVKLFRFKVRASQHALHFLTAEPCCRAQGKGQGPCLASMPVATLSAVPALTRPGQYAGASRCVKVRSRSRPNAGHSS